MNHPHTGSHNSQTIRRASQKTRVLPLKDRCVESSGARALRRPPVPAATTAADRSSGRYSRLEDAVGDHALAVDNHMHHPCRFQSWLGPCCTISHRRWVEHSNVCVRTNLHPPLPRHVRTEVLKPLRGKEGHLPEGLQQTQRFFLSHVFSQDLAKAASATRVRLAVNERYRIRCNLFNTASDADA